MDYEFMNYYTTPKWLNILLLRHAVCLDDYNKIEIEMFEITSYSSNLEKGETEVVKLYE